jgi:hypothetical protein
MMSHLAEIGIPNATQEPDAQELLEMERDRRLDEVVRLWFIYSSIEYAGAALIDVAHANYLKAWHQYTSLFNNTPETALVALLEKAKLEAYYGSYARNVLGTQAR